MIAYKLFRVMKDGSIASLFINKTARHTFNIWIDAENHPTKGYSERFGWHCCKSPHAPHLSMTGRAWYKVDIEDFESIKRPASQGNKWYIAKRIKILDHYEN
jgi:hypothetical protein